MRTLKKVLSLTLVIAFAFSLMAGAFTDNASIAKTALDQVNFMQAVGVIKGFPDGSFGPTKPVTRAEAAKLIYVMKTGKDAGSDNYINAANPFTDVPNGYWAKGYINYCYLNGIIAGIGEGKFDPEGPVTGAQAAKMNLVLMGYEAGKAGLTGPSWLISTMSYAFENKLFDNFSADVQAAAPRQDIAVLFYNTFFAPMVTYRDGAFVNYNTDNKDLPTIGERNFSVVEYEGTLVAADGFGLTSTPAEDTIILDPKDGSANMTFDFVGGRELVGDSVKVVYDDKNDTVYSVVPTSDTIVFNTSVNNIDPTTGSANTKIKVSAKNYTFDANFALFSNYKLVTTFPSVPDPAPATTSSTITTTVGAANYITSAIASTDKVVGLNASTGNPVRFVDTDNDGDFEYGFMTSQTFGYVDSKDAQSIDFGEGGVDLLTDSGKPNVFCDGINEGDYVFYWQDAAPGDGSGAYHLTKATALKGTISGVGAFKGADSTMYIDGVPGSKMFSALPVADNLGDASQTPAKTGDVVTLFIDGSYWVAVIGDTTVAAGDYVYVTGVENKRDITDPLGSNEASVEVLMPGEEKPVVYPLNDDSTLVGGTLDLKNLSNIKDKLFTYEIKSDGSILLSQDMPKYTTGANFAYNEIADIFTVTGVTTPATANGNYILADDAVVFYNNAGTWKILDATDFQTKFDATTGNDSVFSYTEVGGFKYIKAAVITTDGTALPAQSGSDDYLYGYLTGSPMKGHDTATDLDFVKFTMWINGASKSYIQNDTNTYDSDLKRSSFIKFKLNADGTVKEGTAMEAQGKVGDIQAYNSSTSKITISGGVYNITSATQTAYIDFDNVKTTTGSGYPKISASTPSTYHNAYYVLGTGDDAFNLLYIVVDSSQTMTTAIK